MRRMRRPGRFGRRCTPSCRRIHGVGATQVGTTRGRSRRFWRTCGRSSSNASARSSTVRPQACRGCQLRGLKVVVVVLQAGTRMRACLSPAVRTGQPPWRGLRAGHRSTTGHRVRGITKPLLPCRSDLSWYFGGRACRRSGSRIRDELRGQCREELHLHHRGSTLSSNRCVLPCLVALPTP